MTSPLHATQIRPSDAETVTPDSDAMEWLVLSLFKASRDWIPSFVTSTRHRFTILDPDYLHDRSRAKAGLSDWADYLKHALRGWMRISRSRRPTGIVTVFPQLALLIGVFKRVTFSKRPVVAWMFNMGRTYEGMQGRVARFGYAAIDRFVVHSTYEIDVYSQWLRLPRERFVFVPLSVAEKPITSSEETESPFVLSMGTPKRDYALFVDVMRQLPYPTVIVAAAHALADLTIPDNVTVLAGLSEEACRALCQRARLSVVPLQDLNTAAGQVTVVEAMMSGRPVIATRSVGTEDYIDDGVDGLFVEPSDAVALRAMIERVWNDAPLRDVLARAARSTALGKFTFRAVASDLEALLDELLPASLADEQHSRRSSGASR